MDDDARSNYLVLNKQRKHAIDIGCIRQFLSQLAQSQMENPLPLSVVFIDDRSMRTYNRKYRGFDKSTDVLSFRGSKNAKENGVEDYLGDVLISAETAFNQARKSPTLSFETNIRRLVLHGFLHLSGYDHESDNGEMRAIERRLRRKFQC